MATGILKFLAKRLSSMRRIFAVMVAFGLVVGLVFPLVVSPFVTWDPDRKIYFRFACLAAGLAVGVFCYYLVKITLYQRNMLLAQRKAELEEAKDRFASLTHHAIYQQDWNVLLEDEHVPTCWKRKECTATECPAYGKVNFRCWLIAGTYCGGEVQGRFAQKLGDCAYCEIYQEAMGQNPILEIGENFNSLMWAVREKEEMLEDVHQELRDQYQELEELHKQAKERANTDGLTGLKNHGHFQRHLRQEVERASRYHHPLSVAMIDLDKFKNINDKFGHQKGDAVLSHVGRLLQDEIRDIDYCARYGGEEFVIVMPEIAGHQAVKAADRIRQKITQLYREVDLPEHQTAASFGVADFPDCAADNNSLIAAADAALLFAKRQGRNRVSYFSDLSEAELTSSDLDNLNSRLEGAGSLTIQVLAAAVDAKDLYSEENLQDLSKLATRIANTLGFDQVQSDALVLATKFHDIGKIGVPKKVLQKTDKLLPEELKLLHEHPQMGEQILKETEQLQDLIAAVLYHHERWDGKGYPEGLHEEEIPVMARIVGILDAYRAMRSNRPYRQALTIKDAIAELQAAAGSQFDPELVKIVIQQLQEDGEQQLRKAV